MTQLSKNQDRLVRAGVLWQLFMMFSTYDVELDDSTINTRLHQSLGSEEEEFAVVAFEVQNLLAIMAVRALCRVGGLFAEGSEFQSPCHRLVRHVVDSLMTPNLSELLLLSSHHEFLKIFHGECESYTLFWNGDMRHELTTLFRRGRALSLQCQQMNTTLMPSSSGSCIWRIPSTLAASTSRCSWEVFLSSKRAWFQRQ